MTREMRFCQQTKTCDSAAVWKLVPLRLSHRTELQPRDDLIEQFMQKLRIPERLGSASVCVNDPFDSIHNLDDAYC